MTAPFRLAQNAGTGSTSLTLTLPAPGVGAPVMADGDAVVVGAAASTGTITGVSDSQGNAYRLAVSDTAQVATYAWVADSAGNPSGTKALAGGDAVTVTYSSSAADQAAVAVCAPGAAAIAVDVTGSAHAASGTSLSASAGALSSTPEMAIAVAGYGSGGGPIAWGSGWTALGSQEQAGGPYCAIAWQQVAAAPSASAAITSAPWAMLVLAIRYPFPASTLGAKADLLAGGVWEDITPYVYQRKSPVSISRGRPDEISTATAAAGSFELNNRDNRFSPGNPLGPYFGSIGRNTPIRLSIPGRSVGLRLEDNWQDTSSRAECPDTTGLSITGDMDMRIDVELSSCTPSMLASKWDQAGNQRSWAWALNGDGTMSFAWSPDGTTVYSATSTQPVPLGRIALRAQLAVSSSTVHFYTGPPGAGFPGPWTALGAAVSLTGSTSVFDSTAPLRVGGDAGGAQDEFAGYYAPNGTIFEYELKSSSVRANPQFWAEPLTGNVGVPIPVTGTSGAAGSTVFASDYPGSGSMLAAAGIFDGYVGRPMALSAQKVYHDAGQFPTAVGQGYKDLLAQGCLLWLCYKPAFNPTSSSDAAAMVASINAFKAAAAAAGAPTPKVVLWQEPQDVQNGMSAAQCIAMFQYYYSYVNGTGCKVIYNAASNQGESAVTSYYPGDAYCDEIAQDWYCNTYTFSGVTLASLEALADGAVPPKPMGIGEFGYSNTGNQSPSVAQWDAYISYLLSVMTARLTGGKTNSDVMYYAGTGTKTPWNLIESATDFKVAGIQSVYDALVNFTAATGYDFADAQGNGWTLHGSAEITDRDYRFHGELAAIPPRQDPSGQDVWVPAQAAGLLRRLSQGQQPPVMSAMRRAVLSQDDGAGLVAYWPCEDAAGSSQIASGLSGCPPMIVEGSPSFAADSSFACSAAIPTVAKSSWAGHVPDYTDGDSNVVRFLLDIPQASPPANNQVLASVLTSGTCARYHVVYRTGGDLELIGWDVNGNQLFDSGLFAAGADLSPGRVNATLQPSGSNVQWTLNYLPAGDSSATGVSGTFSGSIGNTTKVTISPHSDIDQVGIGHVTVEKYWTSLNTLADPLNAWIGEKAGSRFARLCAENGVPARVVGWPEVSAAMGAQPSGTLMSLLQECEDADRGMIYDARQALALAYRTSASMCSQEPAVVLDYASAHLSGWSPTYDDLMTRNDVTVSRTGGSSATVALDDGSTMSVQVLGDYAYQQQVNVESDSQCADVAGWMVNVGTVDEPRYPSLALDLARPQLASLQEDIAALDVGGYYAVANPPAWLPPGDVKQLAAGLRERIGGYVWTVGIAGVPESAYEAIVLDSASFGLVGSDGSALLQDVAAADTAFEVSWTGVEWQPGSAGFDVVVGGEVMAVGTVGYISDGVQQFTSVTRAVNGVSASHSAGDAVQVYPLSVLAMSGA